MNTDASIIVYKFRPERTGFNMYTEYSQPQLAFLALNSWYRRKISRDSMFNGTILSLMKNDVIDILVL